MISGFLFFRLRMQMLLGRGGKWSSPYWGLAGLFSLIFVFLSFYFLVFIFFGLLLFCFILLSFCRREWSYPYWVVAGLCDCWIWFSQNCLQRSWLLACRQLANPPWWKLLPLSESDFVNPNAYQSPQTWGYGNSQFRAEIAWIWSSDAISVVGNQMIRRAPHKASGEPMSTDPKG